MKTRIKHNATFSENFHCCKLQASIILTNISNFSLSICLAIILINCNEMNKIMVDNGYLLKVNLAETNVSSFVYHKPIKLMDDVV